MKNKFLEESILFVSIVKWTLLASVVGVLVGGGAVLFLKILDGAISVSHDFVFSYPNFFFVLPLGFFLSSLLVYYIAPDARGYGTEKIIEAVHRRAGKIRSMVIPVKMLATVLTAAVGGSVGQIGPCAQIGAALSSMFAGVMRFDDGDRKKLVICGISAGFAAVLGAPISGAIFGVEILVVGAMLYEVLLPSFVAGLVSYQVANTFGVPFFHAPIIQIPVFTDSFFIEVIIAGIFFGICSVIMIETVKYCEKGALKIPLWEPAKALLGGLILIALSLIFSTKYLGLGTETVHLLLRGEKLPAYAFFAKSLFTGVTFAAGGSGGIIAPILFVGAAAGSLFGQLSQLDLATFSAIGMVSVLAGTTNAPISASILAMELFGREIGPFAALACVIGFLMTGHRSVFPTQLLALKKSSSVEVELGGEVSEVRARFKRREKSLIDKGLSALEKMKKRNDHDKRDQS
ncbi:MAG: chloride channel protein [Pseudomonadota bacterium]